VPEHQPSDSKLRQGSYSRTGCWSPPRRGSAGTVLATSYLLGVSTPQIEKLVRRLVYRAVEAAGQEMVRDLDPQMVRTGPCRWTPRYYSFSRQTTWYSKSVRTAGS
jgi:hypothetical protein